MGLAISQIFNTATITPDLRDVAVSWIIHPMGVILYLVFFKGENCVLSPTLEDMEIKD